MRISSLDIVRGLVMILMALDHTREYFHFSYHFFDPTDPAQSTLPIFFTRFVTHVCAPAFSLLAGISAFLGGQHKTKTELSVFLIKRGLWLIMFELMIMNFGEHFDFLYRDVLIETLCSLGVSMICLSALLHLPSKWLFGVSLLIICAHNLLDTIQSDSIAWLLLHKRDGFSIPGHGFYVAYPVIPWIFVMSLGYCIGHLFSKTFDPMLRVKYLFTAGAGSLGGFLLLRVLNVYGDPAPRHDFGDLAQNVMSFFNVSKYPPSLEFLLLTLGATFLLLAMFEKVKGNVSGFIEIFGRVPLFFYAIHIFLIHALAMLAAQLSGYGWKSMILLYVPDKDPLKGFGFGLPVIYLIWIGVIAVVYPLCKAYDRFKGTHRYWWLSYI